MKKILLLLSLTSASLWAQIPPPAGAEPPPGLAVTPATPAPRSAGTEVAPVLEKGFTTITPSRFGNLTESELNKVYGKMEINFKGMTMDDFLAVYAETVKRTVLRSGTLPATPITIVNQTPLTGREMIQLLDAVLAINGIGVVNVDDKFVKVMPLAEVGGGAQRINQGDPTLLPELGQYTTHVVQLKYVKPAEMMPIIAPFAKIPNSILPVEGNNILVIRDFAENVKRMLEMIEKIDITVDSEFICEVIPIKYALAGDINSALNSLSGAGGGATVGSSTSSTRGASSSRSGRTGGTGGSRLGNVGTQGGQYSGAAGQQPTSGLGSTGGGSTFTDRLKQIVTKATQSGGGGSGDFSIIGATKIIADERTNSLLIYASREDMKTIKDIISKLDVVLAQVLIESIILGVSADAGMQLGVSASQDPKSLGNKAVGAGVMNNEGNPLTTGLNWLTGSGTNAGSIPALGGMNYFGQISQDWNVAVKAISQRGKTEVIQRPVIMTTHATPGSFFVGRTRPYVTSTYYGGGFGGGPSSSYQQLRVGIELSVTPFINPDGIVVMKIEQAIEDFDGVVTIDGNEVPKTVSRTLSADVTVRDRDTIVLGGYMNASGSKSKSGVPLLKDIPVLGHLFSSSTSDKNRQELLVLMRPTVLKTPELAAMGSRIERDRMTGVSRFEKKLDKEDAEFDRQMDQLDGVKKTKATTPTVNPTPETTVPEAAPSTSKVEDQHAEMMRRAMAQKNSQTANDVMQTEAAIVASRQGKAGNKNSFKAVQPMTDEEKKLFGRTSHGE